MMPKSPAKTPERLMVGFLVLAIMAGSGVLTGCLLAPTPVDIAPFASPTPTSTFPGIQAPLLPQTSTNTAAITTTGTSTPSATWTSTSTPAPVEVHFAVIGDYGMDNSAEADVAALIQGWQPDFIITTGDNNYPSGEAETIDANIGKYFHNYIYPYSGDYGSGADMNRFFPTLGNHDWYTSDAQPYLDYFTLPGNERYYDFIWGPIHFFALDSDENEPDGINAGSAQAAWLQRELAASTSPWNIVYMHYPAYSSGSHGSTDWMQWPFASWGAEAVLAGHDHLYERLMVDGIPYFTNGAGGAALYNFETILPESQFRYNANYGAMLVTVSETEMLFEFYNRNGDLIDEYKISRP
jgi:tartrate-resistant acid phosphatase type 5